MCKWNSRRLWILWRWILEGCGDCVGGILEVCGYFMYLIFVESRGGRSFIWVGIKYFVFNICWVLSCILVGN